MTLLDQKLTLVDDVIQDGYHPVVTVVYFVPDARKAARIRNTQGKYGRLTPLNESSFSSQKMNVLPAMGYV